MSDRTYLGVALGLCALVILQNAWLCDDAFISFRTADNLLNGYGLTWNTGERVQASTNPLWLFLVAFCYFLSGEIYYTAILLGASVSLLAVYFALPKSDGHAALTASAFLLGSKAFIDFSTSGLENPLTFLLLALFIRTYIEQPHNIFRLALFASLSTLNRMDTVLFYLPALVAAWWPHRDLRTAATMALGFVPFILWEAFSIVYYGFPFPNTAYAKLAGGIEAGELAQQGLLYAAQSLQFDPLTLCTIAVAVGFVLWRRDASLIWLVFGILLYLLYTVRIGGDFMGGRFYAAPYLAAVALLMRAMPRPNGRRWLFIPVLVVGLAAAGPHPTFLSGSDYGTNRVDDPWAEYNCGDERYFYYPYTGLLNAISARQDTLFPIHGWADWGRQLRQLSDAGLPAVVTWPYVGFLGFYAGPECYLIDIFGLGDPLTARLPARRDIPWRIGHLRRILPAGYFETHLYGTNLIADTQLATYYDALQQIISGDLFSRKRWLAIWKMHTGRYDHLIEAEKYRLPDPADVERSERMTMGAEGTIPITFKPIRFMHFSGLGDVYFGRGQYMLAVKTYRDALKLDDSELRRHHPDDYRDKVVALYLRLAQALVALDQIPAARAVLEAHMKIDPENKEVLRALQALSVP